MDAARRIAVLVLGVALDSGARPAELIVPVVLLVVASGLAVHELTPVAAREARGPPGRQVPEDHQSPTAGVP